VSGRQVSALRATARSAMAEAWANRAGFWTQLTAMAVNDIAWIAFWLLFFDRVGEVRGWDSSRILMLFAVLTTGAGFVLGFLSNARRIGPLIADGALDAALALPVPPLAHLLVRRFDATHLGDVVFGVTLFVLTGTPTLERTAIYLAGVAAAIVVLTGFLVATGSLAFFTGRGEAGDFGLHAMLVLANYPADIFAGVAKALLYTVVPAAFVSTVPARLVDDFDLAQAVAMLGVAAAFGLAGWATFTAGLRRYTSGAVWTRP
jgi:ABC-2 type transport system permease protein